MESKNKQAGMPENTDKQKTEKSQISVGEEFINWAEQYWALNKKYEQPSEGEASSYSYARKCFIDKINELNGSSGVNELKERYRVLKENFKIVSDLLDEEKSKKLSPPPKSEAEVEENLTDNDLVKMLAKLPHRVKSNEIVYEQRDVFELMKQVRLLSAPSKGKESSPESEEVKILNERITDWSNKWGKLYHINSDLTKKIESLETELSEEKERSAELLGENQKKIQQLITSTKGKYSDDTLVGFWFTNEHGHEVNVIAESDDWCMVEEEGKKTPYALPKEFVMTIKAESFNTKEQGK